METRSPASVWVLGCVSLLVDVSSEIIHSLLPIFLIAGLAVLAASDAILAHGTQWPVMLAGVAPWGCTWA